MNQNDNEFIDTMALYSKLGPGTLKGIASESLIVGVDYGKGEDFHVAVRSFIGNDNGKIVGSVDPIDIRYNIVSGDITATIKFTDVSTLEAVKSSHNVSMSVRGPDNPTSMKDCKEFSLIEISKK